jgi:anti-anti-sigma regulatory factor
LVRAHRLLETIGGTLTLRSPSDPVRVILEITRLASFFTLALLPV